MAALGPGLRKGSLWFINQYLLEPWRDVKQDGSGRPCFVEGLFLVYEGCHTCAFLTSVLA